MPLGLVLRAQLAQQALVLQVRQELRGPELQEPLEPQVQAPLALQALQALTAQPVLQAWELQVQPEPRAQEYLVPPELRVLVPPVLLDHKDFLLASLTTTQEQRQQVAIQAMDLFCGIMLHKLMQHNYWLAT